MPVRPFWVFGYGSLIWDQGFAVEERVVATLDGWHRSFCMRSIHHRGTVERPGLVLALDAAQGAQCHGVAFRIADAEAAVVHRILRERELISSAYLEEVVTLDLVDGRRVRALAYVIDRAHAQYCTLGREEQARIIARAVGGRGRNRDYLANTVRHLDELGLPDGELAWLDARVRRLAP